MKKLHMGMLFLLGLTTAVVYPRALSDGLKRPASVAENNDHSYEKGHAVRPKRKTMTTSWYGRKFHGKKTASGRRFNMYALTAAHRVLPFGTRLKLRNPNNQKQVVVTITDRGPHIEGRHLDISRKAAEALKMVRDGVAVLHVKILKTSSS
ncbi:MAG: septal ring lytic transglycosylase RlpA family protein [Patescibacteria group bacterium]|jgi:rare lipoprotein A